MPADSLEAEFLRFQATVRQHLECIIPQAVTHSLVLLKMGGIVNRNILSWLESLINRYCCIEFVVCIIYINDARSSKHKNGKIPYSQTSHRWKYNTAHVRCILGNWGYRGTLRMCNICFFCIATIVTPTRLSIPLDVHYLFTNQMWYIIVLLPIFMVLYRF